MTARRIFVVDTNVVVAGLITADSDSPTARILDAMLRGRLIYLVSGDLLQEYIDVLSRPRLFRYHGLDRSQIDRLSVEIAANALWRDPSADTNFVSPDPNDAHLWALLASEPASILITGDQLLIDNPRPNRSIISPATWAAQFCRI